MKFYISSINNKVDLEFQQKLEITVSRFRVRKFKDWLVKFNYNILLNIDYLNSISIPL